MNIFLIYREEKEDGCRQEEQHMQRHQSEPG